MSAANPSSALASKYESTRSRQATQSVGFLTRNRASRMATTDSCSRRMRSTPLMIKAAAKLNTCLAFPLLVAITVHSSWLIFDLCVTSKIYHPPPKPYVPPTASSPLSPFYGQDYQYAATTDTTRSDLKMASPFDFPTRAFPPIQFPASETTPSSYPFCEKLMPMANLTATSTTPSGIIFIPVSFTDKTDELSGIVARVARNVAHRQNQTSAMNPRSLQQEQICTSRLKSPLKTKRFRNRKRTNNESFLFSFLQEPVHRTVQTYFTACSIQGITPSQNDFVSFLETQSMKQYGTYLRTLTPRRHVNPEKIDDFEVHLREVLDAMDFVGITERWEESIAVLQLLMGLEVHDMLHTPSSASKFDFVQAPGILPFLGRQNGRSFCIQKLSLDETDLPPTLPLMQIKEALYQPDLYDELFKADILFYQAINASLDKTIESLGRERVEATARQFRWAQDRMQTACFEGKDIQFPCTPTGEILDSSSDCFFQDVGCGFKCMDEIAGTSEG